MIVDGRKLASHVLEQVASDVVDLSRTPRLSIITCTPNFETGKYLALKKRRAAAVGISTNVIELLADCTTEGAVDTVKTAADSSDAVVVQLPLPDHIDTNKVLAAIPLSHDVDGIHYAGDSEVLPPVVGAIAEICRNHTVSMAGKAVVIVGAGRLVGVPALLWASEQGAHVSLITRETPETEVAAALAAADIIISGVGQSHLITPSQIKPGVQIFDAGTSEDGGALVGDVDPACAEVADLFTPVPGGIGPITIACLLKNVVILARQ